MDDAGDPMLVEDAAETLEVGDVALDEGDTLPLLRREDELEPVRPVAEVEAERLVVRVERGLERPGADATERSRDENALAQ